MTRTQPVPLTPENLLEAAASESWETRRAVLNSWFVTPEAIGTLVEKGADVVDQRTKEGQWGDDLDAEIEILKDAALRSDTPSKALGTLVAMPLVAQRQVLQNERNHIAKDIATTSHVAVSVEDLKAKSMSAAAKGTVEHPGNRVAQKRGLNRSLQRVGVRAMLDAIERSCRKNGKDFFGVPPHYTSQTCSLCGEIGKR